MLVNVIVNASDKVAALCQSETGCGNPERAVQVYLERIVAQLDQVDATPAPSKPKSTKRKSASRR